jgi:hypothetical protein
MMTGQELQNQLEPVGFFAFRTFLVFGQAHFKLVSY